MLNLQCEICIILYMKNYSGIGSLSMALISLAISIFSCGNSANADEISAPDRAGNPVRKLRVTEVRDNYNVLAPQGLNTYYGKNMFDGDPTTGWAVKLSEGIIDSDTFYGPLITVNAKSLDHVRIMNGYGKNRNAFLKNTRAAWITLYRDDYMEGVYPDECDIIYNGPLQDTMEFQTLQVNPEFDNSRPTRRVGIIIPSYYEDEDNGGGGYYMGTKWDDLVISELEFYGLPK